MHFIIAVILYALYFVTMTKSVGVNLAQVQLIVDLVKESENTVDEIPPEQFISKLVELGVDNVEGWKYEAGTTDGQKTQRLMVYLAKNNKIEDSWVIISLSSQEVIVYLSLFTYHENQGPVVDGLINLEEFKNIIEGLRLNREEKEDFAEFLQDDETVNFAEFLFGILAIKYKGIDELNRGLDMSQITFLSINILQNKNNDYIESEKIKEFINWLPIISGVHDALEFERFQKWPLEMQELVIVSAEYNTTANDKNGIVISTSEVRGYVWRFAVSDTNRDGFLSGNELDNIVNCKEFERFTVSTFMAGDSNEDEKLDILEMFALIIKKRAAVRR
ncbi:uncharacterized protein LOC126838909 isoform X1 [Adelges cooleyi]|uniref:uncharacterized protein LOC126838909 isoform X1 n=1 Tax=Adelges cooleyi TaxID=133065 RepID=UPI0021804F79|nr:uncharacterized protein LOC126838909 isoform X1 [Adelges cooleyi]